MSPSGYADAALGGKGEKVMRDYVYARYSGCLWNPHDAWLWQYVKVGEALDVGRRGRAAVLAIMVGPLGVRNLSV